MSRSTRAGEAAGCIILAAVLAAGALLGFGAGVVLSVDGCRPEPITDHTPTGIAGCVVYGDGIASRWPGPGVARNDCVYPWSSCTPIRVTSLETGRSIDVVPIMFCDCYTGTSDARLVDLDPAAVAALGLEWSRGLFPIRVEPIPAGDPPPAARPTTPALLPDTAMQVDR